MLSSSQKSAVLSCLLATAAQAGQPGYTPQDAVRAEWARRPPQFSAEQRQRLSPAEVRRLDLSLARIGAPGAPALLPPELAAPTLDLWLARAQAARTPQERFTALFFLNRLKSPEALTALAGLGPQDARNWPRDLHLEGPVAAARLNGASPAPAVQGFLTALPGDPVRAAAAHLRLVLAGKEAGVAHLPEPLTLASLDAWNRGPWELRSQEQLALLPRVLAPGDLGLAQRILEGLPAQAGPAALETALAVLEAKAPVLLQAAALEHLGKLASLSPATLARLEPLARSNPAAPLWGPWLELLRKHAPASAEALGQPLLTAADPLALAAGIENLQTPPADLEPLIQRLWSTAQYDGAQVFLPALERWKLPEAQVRAVLLRFLQHPCWTARLDAYNLLRKSDPALPWPEVPEAGPSEAPVLKEALRLAAAGRPVRLRLSFTRQRQVTLRLDPRNAPINVANLALLARKGYFNGRLVPRVVPDFVVQMGSPVDTMDGGPGYTVRCENSLDWYGPGSVGMALSGKDTGGSQFFITTNAAPHLTGRYTRIGAVENPAQALPLLDRLELGARILKAEVLR